MGTFPWRDKIWRQTDTLGREGGGPNLAGRYTEGKKERKKDRPTDRQTDTWEERKKDRQSEWDNNLTN